MAKALNIAKGFAAERKRIIRNLSHDKKLTALGLRFTVESLRQRYSFNFDWLGRPIIQHPQDIVAFQELMWRVKPDLVIETGIAHGGSLILSSSILELIGGKGQVVGIDIDIRRHNRIAIERHRLFKLGRIVLIEGSSTAPQVIAKVRALARRKRKVMVFLDSAHSHAHVLSELETYAPMVSKGSYVVVSDTVEELRPAGSTVGRPWGKGNNAGTAVAAFLKTTRDFVPDDTMDHKLLITAALGGFLKRVR